MLDSIHAARWLTQFADENIDFKIFPSKKFKRLNSKFIDLLKNQSNAKFSIIFPTKFVRLMGYIDFGFFVVLAKILKRNLRQSLLSKELQSVEYDYVHALELQGAGYLIANSFSQKPHKKSRIQFIATNWGSDIYHFARIPEHLKQIKQVLITADRYSAECLRDYELARNLGFKGVELPCIPNAGGFEIESNIIKLKKPSKRKGILIKGYGGEFGRFDLILPLIENFIVTNPEFNWFVYSASDEFVVELSKIKDRNPKNFDFSTIRSPLSHSEVIKKFQNSRIYVGASESDGISTSFLEALISGTFPIQTGTSCANEWVIRGYKAAIVGLDSSEIQEAISKALKNDGEVDQAFLVNAEKSREDLSFEKLKLVALSFYQELH